jgi:dTDP-4-amino-4,6-dideoxygalactose transaminase
MQKISFIDLAAQQSVLRARIDAAIAEVLDAGSYIMGAHVKKFETEIAAFCGAKNALGCANGTDALLLALKALGTGPGDAVFVPSFTFAATAEIVPATGATPWFVDVDQSTFNMDPDSLSRSIEAARKAGLKPSAVIPVDLFGLPANMPAIDAIAKDQGMTVICDSAQGFGGRINGQMTGTFGAMTTTSFFPAKPLGCYGDGGAVFTEDDELARLIDSYRVHGKGADKYDNVRIGMNSRLDTMQAAILSVKLAIYAEEITARNKAAANYDALLAGRTALPFVPEGYESVWAQYTIRLPGSEARGRVQGHLSSKGIPTMIYYPVPLHRLSAYNQFPRDPNGLSVCESVAGQVLSLPMHPYIEPDTQEFIASSLIEAL